MADSKASKLLLVQLLIASCLSGLNGTPIAFAGTSTNREIAQVRARWHLSQQERTEAIAVLREHLLEDAQDDAALLLLGLILMEDGKFREAGDFFRKAALITQGERRVISLYNLADSYFRNSQPKEAVEALKLAASGQTADLDAALKEHLLAIAGRVESGEALPPYRRPLASRFGMTASVATGYDTNVLLASDASLAASEDTGTSSFQLAPAVQAAWFKPLKGGDRAFTFGGYGAFSWNATSEAQAFNSLALSQTSEWAPAIATSSGFSVGNQIDLVLLNSDGLGFFDAVETLKPRYQFRHSSSNSTDLDIGIRYQVFAAPSDPDYDRTGPGVRPRIVHRRRIGPVLASVGLAYDQQLAAGSEYRASSIQVPVSVTVPRLWKSLGLVVSAEVASTDYSDSAAGRSDLLVQANAGFRLPWLARSLIGLDLGFRSNSSTVDAATYSKQQVQLSFSQDLF